MSTTNEWEIKIQFFGHQYTGFFPQLFKSAQNIVQVIEGENYIEMI